MNNIEENKLNSDFYFDLDISLKNNTPKYENLVLSGGSTKGISHIGALRVLIDEKLIDFKSIKAIACTSAGAMLGFLIVLGFEIEEIWDFMLGLDLKRLVEPNILMFLDKCGVDTGKIIYKLIEDILSKKTGIKHINFKQLYEITKIHFTVVGSCLTTREAIYYDHINTPNFKVSMAIRISIGIPGFFTPIVIDGKKYIDGAVMNNYPINIFKKELDKTIGILIHDEFNTDYQHPEEYFMAIMNLFLYRYYHKNATKYIDNTICIQQKKMPGLSVFDFNITDEVKIKLYECGMETAHDFINQKIKRKIIEGDFEDDDTKSP
jgi:NTE family protein